MGAIDLCQAGWKKQTPSKRKVQTRPGKNNRHAQKKNIPPYTECYLEIQRYLRRSDLSIQDVKYFTELLEYLDDEIVI